MVLLSMERFCGYDVWIELRSGNCVDTMCEVNRTAGNTEVWLFRRLQILIGDLAYYERSLHQQQHQD